MEATDNHIIRYQNGEDVLQHLTYPLVNTMIIANHLKKRHLRIYPDSYNSRLELHFSEIKKLTICENCSLTVDLRDNPYIKEIVIKDGFSGSINLSRSSVRKISVGTNCRCDLTLENSLNCFKFSAGDVFSGHVRIKESCFHKLSVGYYCYADISLTKICGRKKINIGDSFRGMLKMSGLSVPRLNIGHDCRGSIIQQSQNEEEHTKRLHIKDDFAGTLDLSNDGQTEKIEVGSFASGTFNLLNCRGLKFIKFEDAFSGVADLSESDVEYVRAGSGCRGRIVVLNCPRLTLLELPLNKKGDITAERNPLRIELVRGRLSYRFHERGLPRSYFTPFYVVWLRQLGRSLRRL